MKKTEKFKNIMSLSLLSMLALVVIVMFSSFISRVIISPPVDPTLDRHIKPCTAEEVIQVNILNAGAANGSAGKVMNYMRQRGFDVVEIGNNPNMRDQSCIIDRIGDIESAKKVAYAIGISDSLISTKVDSSLYLRASIIIGKDFTELKPFK